MSGLTTPSRAASWVARPLSSGELAEADQVAGRLHAELGHLVASLPEHARHASGMARQLGVLRVTCQRVVQAIQGGPPSARTLARLPGVEGLRQVLDAFRRVEPAPSREDLDAAESAIEAYERLVTTTGGSQSRLNERLNLTTAASTDGALATLADRESLLASAARITGRLCDVSLSIYAFRVAPDDPASLERALAKGLIGSVVTPGGLPMILSSGDTVRAEDEVRQIRLLGGEAAAGRTPEAILGPFTSDPLPMVTSRSKGGSLFQIIDPSAASAGEPLDVVTALKARHPLMDPQTGRTTLDAVWSLVNCPARKLIFDVYLHADMERWYRPSIDALLWAPTLNVPEDDKWVMRLPAQPRLQMLGRGFGSAASDLYPRHGELTRYFFEHIGWDADEFLGFRCEVQAPVWRAGYCMGFEYLRGRPEAEAPTPDNTR